MAIKRNRDTFSLVRMSVVVEALDVFLIISIFNSILIITDRHYLIKAMTDYWTTIREDGSNGGEVERNFIKFMLIVSWLRLSVHNCLVNYSNYGSQIIIMQLRNSSS